MVGEVSLGASVNLDVHCASCVVHACEGSEAFARYHVADIEGSSCGDPKASRWHTHDASEHVGKAYARCGAQDVVVSAQEVAVACLGKIAARAGVLHKVKGV